AVRDFFQRLRRALEILLRVERKLRHLHGEVFESTQLLVESGRGDDELGIGRFVLGHAAQPSRVLESPISCSLIASRLIPTGPLGAAKARTERERPHAACVSSLISRATSIASVVTECVCMLLSDEATLLVRPFRGYEAIARRADGSLVE